MSQFNKHDLHHLIARQNGGYSLEQDFYCSPEIFTRDMKQLISKRWLMVDHASRIPNVGDYFLFNIGNESIIVIRETLTQINAFFNVCRHRGSKICLEDEGTKKALTCPYHAWTYMLDGSLRRPRLMPSDFDPEQFGLHKAHCRVFHGIIFVSLATQPPPDFDQHYAPFSDVLKFHGLEDTKIAVQRNYPNEANWKLVVENFLECYHCGPAHPEYSAVHPRDQLLALGAGPGSGPKEALDNYQPIWSAWEEKAKSLGHPLPLVEEGPETVNMCQLSRFPIADENTYSETRDGQLACRKLLGSIEENDKGETAIVFNPLSYILATNDVVLMIRFTPRSTLQTDVQLSWLVHKDAEEGIDYDPDNVAWVWDTTIRQDETITENNQAGVLSKRYCPGPYSQQETMLINFQEWYLRLIA